MEGKASLTRWRGVEGDVEDIEESDGEAREMKIGDAEVKSAC
jgi:hypothetical protein